MIQFDAKDIPIQSVRGMAVTSMPANLGTQAFLAPTELEIRCFKDNLNRALIKSNIMTVPNQTPNLHDGKSTATHTDAFYVPHKPTATAPMQNVPCTHVQTRVHLLPTSVWIETPSPEMTADQTDPRTAPLESFRQTNEPMPEKPAKNAPMPNQRQTRLAAPLVRTSQDLPSSMLKDPTASKPAPQSPSLQNPFSGIPSTQASPLETTSQEQFSSEQPVHSAPSMPSALSDVHPQQSVVTKKDMAAETQTQTMAVTQVMIPTRPMPQNGQTITATQASNTQARPSFSQTVTENQASNAQDTPSISQTVAENQASNAQDTPSVSQTTTEKGELKSIPQSPSTRPADILPGIFSQDYVPGTPFESAAATSPKPQGSFQSPGDSNAAEAWQPVVPQQKPEPPSPQLNASIRHEQAQVHETHTQSPSQAAALRDILPHAIPMAQTKDDAREVVPASQQSTIHVAGNQPEQQVSNAQSAPRVPTEQTTLQPPRIPISFILTSGIQQELAPSTSQAVVPNTDISADQPKPLPQTSQPMVHRTPDSQPPISKQIVDTMAPQADNPSVPVAKQSSIPQVPIQPEKVDQPRLSGKPTVKQNRVNQPLAGKPTSESSATQNSIPANAPQATDGAAMPPSTFQPVISSSALSTAQHLTLTPAQILSQTVDDVASTLLTSFDAKTGVGEIRLILKPEVLNGTEVRLVGDARHINVTFFTYDSTVNALIAGNQLYLAEQVSAKTNMHVKVSVIDVPNRKRTNSMS